MPPVLFDFLMGKDVNITYGYLTLPEHADFNGKKFSHDEPVMPDLLVKPQKRQTITWP